MRTWTALFVALLWGACSSGSGSKDAMVNQPDTRTIADTKEVAADAADSAAKPGADVAESIVDTLDSAAEAAETAARDMGPHQDAADDARDAPLDTLSPDTLSADLGGVDALVSPCEMAVTGSCLVDIAGDQWCTDYTDTDSASSVSRCNADTSRTGVWSPHPCVLDRFRTGCRHGTPGAAGCYVEWTTRGANFEISCLSYQGVPIRLY